MHVQYIMQYIVRKLPNTHTCPDGQLHENNKAVTIMGAQSSKDRLSKAEVEFFIVNTRYDENTIQKWYKGFMADCPDGKLNTTAFIKIYSKCFPSGNTREFCDHVFRTFDSDRNGFIDFKEFLLAMDITSSGSPEEKLNWAFRLDNFILCQLVNKPVCTFFSFG